MDRDTIVGLVLVWAAVPITGFILLAIWARQVIDRAVADINRQRDRHADTRCPDDPPTDDEWMRSIR